MGNGPDPAQTGKDVSSAHGLPPADSRLTSLAAPVRYPGNPYLLLVTGLVLTASACLHGDEGTGRRPIAVKWDTAWVLTDQSDPPVLQPEAIAAHNGKVFLVDLAVPGVLAVDAKTGRKLWATGRRGIGPGEFLDPYQLLPNDEGVTVVDQTTRRTTHLGPDGRLLSTTSLAALGGAPLSGCALDGGDLLFSVFAADSFVRLDSSGHRRESVAMPFGVRDSRGVVNQVFVAGDTEMRVCAAGLMLGGGFAVISPAPVSMHQYVEDMPVPRWLLSSEGEDSLSSDLAATLDAEVRHDTLWTLFEGRSASQRRLLDGYSVPSGRYLGTLELPTRANRFAMLGDLLVLKAGQPDGSFAVLALRRR